MSHSCLISSLPVFGWALILLLVLIAAAALRQVMQKRLLNTSAWVVTGLPSPLSSSETLSPWGCWCPASPHSTGKDFEQKPLPLHPGPPGKCVTSAMWTLPSFFFCSILYPLNMPDVILSKLEKSPVWRKLSSIALPLPMHWTKSCKQLQLWAKSPALSHHCPWMHARDLQQQAQLSWPTVDANWRKCCAELNQMQIWLLGVPKQDLFSPGVMYSNGTVIS